MLKVNAGVAQSVEQLIRNQQVAGSNPATSSNKAHTDKVRVGFIASCTDSNPSNPGAGLDKFALRKRRNSHEHSAQTGVQNPAMIRTLSVWALLHLVPILTPPTPTGLDKFALRKRGNQHEHPAQTGV